MLRINTCAEHQLFTCTLTLILFNCRWIALQHRRRSITSVPVTFRKNFDPIKTNHAEADAFLIMHRTYDAKNTASSDAPITFLKNFANSGLTISALSFPIYFKQSSHYPTFIKSLRLAQLFANYITIILTTNSSFFHAALKTKISLNFVHSKYDFKQFTSNNRLTTNHNSHHFFQHQF